jgi:hypothetical protein
LVPRSKAIALFERLGCEAEHTEAWWRAASARGASASLADLLGGVLQGKLAAERVPRKVEEAGLVRTHLAVRGSHLRLAALDGVFDDVVTIEYAVGTAGGLVLLEVLQTRTGQPWLVLADLPGIDPTHFGAVLRSVNGTAVGGMEPNEVEALLLQGVGGCVCSLQFADDREGVLGDARFAALLAKRAGTWSGGIGGPGGLTAGGTTGGGGAMLQKARQRIVAIQAAQEQAIDDTQDAALSTTAEPLARFVFESLRSHCSEYVGEGEITGRAASLAVHCINHAIPSDTVLELLLQLSDSDSSKGSTKSLPALLHGRPAVTARPHPTKSRSLDPADWFAAAEMETDDPYSSDEGGNDYTPAGPSTVDPYVGRYVVLRAASCREEASLRSPVCGEVTAGQTIDVIYSHAGDNNKIRVKCTMGWLSLFSGTGESLSPLFYTCGSIPALREG